MPSKRKNKKKQNKKAKVKAKKVIAPKDQQVLPSQLATKFQSLVRNYEYGKYDKGIKDANKILEEYPHNGETLAMKGLCQLNLKKKDEGEGNINAGLKLNIRSHICWHTRGLMFRHKQDYAQAAKCLINALKLAPDDNRIITDVGQLYIQERDYERFTTQRGKLLPTKPSARAHWVATSVGHYLCNRLERSYKLIDTWFKTSKTKSDASGGAKEENNEMLFLQAKSKMGLGNIEEAIEFMKTNEKYFTNKLDCQLMTADFLEKNGDQEEAMKIYINLVKRNPENEEYFKAVLRCRNKTPENDLDEIIKFHEELAEQYPKADAPKLRLLFLTSGDMFTEKADAYMQHKIRRSVTSLFKLLEKIIEDEDKRARVRNLLEQYIEQLKNHRRFSENDEENSEGPGTVIWAMYCYGMFLDEYNEPELAFSIVDEALEVAPTCIDFIMLRARIYKHQANYAEAYKWMEHARKLDAADRFLNTRCVRYGHRAGNFQNAEWALRLFLRRAEGVECLEDLQVVWYTFAHASGYSYHNMYWQCLRECERIFHVYQNVWNDQFDFHHYALRKATCVTYLKMLEWEDNLRRETVFVKTAKLAIKTYLHLYDLQKTGADPELEKKSLPEEDTPPTPITGLDKKERLIPKDYSESPLKGAIRWVEHLRSVVRDDIDTFSLSAAVYRRKKKYLLATRCLASGKKLDPNNANLLSEIFLLAQDLETNKIPAEVAEHIHIHELREAKTQTDFVGQIASTKSILHQHAALQCTLFLGADTSPFLTVLSQLPGDIEECKMVYSKLSSQGQITPAIIEHFKSLFPYSAWFNSNFKETETQI